MIVTGKEIHADIALKMEAFDEWMCCKDCGERRRDCDCDHSKELAQLGYDTCRYCEDGQIKKVEWHGVEEQEVRLCDECAINAGWEV